MIKTLQNTLKQDREGFSPPKSVQDAIPIRCLWPDGIFQYGTKFSKTIRFSDINYAIASKEDKTSMFLGYSELLNALDTGSTTKITINNRRLNRNNFEQEILLGLQEDPLDAYRVDYNAMLMDKVTDSSNSVVQERYITLSVHKKTVEEARAFFDRVTADVITRPAIWTPTARNWTPWSGFASFMTSTAPDGKPSSMWTCGPVCATGSLSRIPSARTSLNSRRTTSSWAIRWAGCCSYGSLPAISRTA